MKNNLKLKIIGTLLLTVGLSFLIHFTRPQSDYSQLLLDWFWVNKTHYSSNSNIIFVGDSRTYRAISPMEVQKEFPNKTVVNFGYSSGGINKEMLNSILQLIDTNDKIKIIILGITPFSLSEEARKNEHYHQEMNRTLADIVERKYINPHLTNFEPIKITDYQDKKNSTVYPQVFHKNGWVESYKLPIDYSEALDSYKKTFLETKMSKTSVDETLNFISQMKTKGIKVYGFRPPSCKEMEKLENELSGFKENEFVALFKKNDGIWIDIPDRYSFDTYDGSHLHFQSAKKLSTILAKKINQQ